MNAHVSAFHVPTDLDRKEKPFPCPYCDSHFSRDDLINRHVRTFHPDAPPIRKVKKKQQANSEGAAGDTAETDGQISLNELDFHRENLSQLGGFDLLAAISTLSAEPGLATLPSSIEQTEMPVERTWFAFNWFSDFFKDLTEPASSENLHIRKVQTLDSPTLSPLEEGRDETRPWRPILTKHVSSLYERIMQLKRSKQLPADFILPSRNKVSRYLSAFFGYFNPHIPLVHTQSFDFTNYSRMTTLNALMQRQLYYQFSHSELCTQMNTKPQTV